jgi:curved DNA-binding protein CbpA
MDGRTYYMVLGVPRTASPAGIRSAYRDLARKLHPDVAGEQATPAFQEISEAYDVLSDPQRRRAYNDELRRAESGAAVPVRAGSPAPWAPESIFTPVEELECLNIEIVLTPAEARRGCVLSLGLSVFQILRVHVPPIARSGSVFEVDLPGVRLRLHVFVDPG